MPPQQHHIHSTCHTHLTSLDTGGFEITRCTRKQVLSPSGAPPPNSAVSYHKVHQDAGPIPLRCTSPKRLVL
eukprot:scaffold110225_cov20-Tisochrysis_lutea.AAC.2